MLLFSIIVPVYNSERYLTECIQSVLRQRFENLEIILVDDFSTDKSGKICDFFAKENKFIKVIHHEMNLGVSVSRNRGINAASGEYIIFLDSDDCLFNDCLGAIAKLIKDKPDADAVICGYATQGTDQQGGDFLSREFISGYNASVNTDDPNGIIAYIKDFRLFTGVCWRYVINRKFIIKNNIFFVKAKIYEDQEFVGRLLCLAKSFSFYDGCLYWYRQRSESLTRLNAHKKDHDVSLGCLEAANELCKFMKNNYLTDLQKDFLYARIENVLKIFYGQLLLDDRKEIYECSRYIERFTDNLEVLKDSPYDREFFFFIKNFGPFYGPLLFRTLVKEKIIFLVKDKENKAIYIFCAGLFGQAAAQILLSEGYSLKGFLDNNKTLEGNTVLGLEVSSPDFLSGRPKDRLDDIFVIVCQRFKSVSDEISSQLEGLGLRKEQIAHQIF